MPLKMKGLGLLGVLGVLGIAAAIAVPSLGPSGTAAHADGNAGSVAFSPETSLVPAEARCTSNDFIDSSLQTVKSGDANHRQFATAISIPFKGTTDDAANKEIISEICGNPTVLKMVADDMMLWTGFPGADSNKVWLKTKVIDKINDKGLDSFLAKKNQNGDDLVVSEEFQKYAGWINTVLLRFNTDGKQSLASVRNWEQPATVDPTTQPVAVQASTQESKPAWVRTLKDKNGTCLYKIGFNTEDKRIETFNCVTPKPTSHPSTTPSKPSQPSKPSTGCTTNCGGTTTTTTPGCKTNCGTTTTPGCKTNCGGTPTCTSCLTPKDPKNDVKPPQGTTKLGPDPVQPVAPAPKPDPVKPSTPVHSDPGPSVPVQGAKPAPSAPAAPSIPVTQQPAPSNPGTPITDPDG